jgi:hypothetical protein
MKASLLSFHGVEMDEQTDASEIWFERIGPTFGWFGSYIPTTMKGFDALLMHILPVLILWVLPLSLLGHFEVVAEPVVFALVFPVVIGCLVSLMRIAHRHSLAPT